MVVDVRREVGREEREGREEKLRLDYFNAVG
jgi:hypothetical protein